MWGKSTKVTKKKPNCQLSNRGKATTRFPRDLKTNYWCNVLNRNSPFDCHHLRIMLFCWVFICGY